MEPYHSCLLVFFLALIMDILSTCTIKWVATGKKAPAVIGSMLLSIAGLASVYIIVNDKSFYEILCYIIGVGIGTYLSMCFFEKRKK